MSFRDHHRVTSRELKVTWNIPHPRERRSGWCRSSVASWHLQPAVVLVVCLCSAHHRPRPSRFPLAGGDFILACGRPPDVGVTAAGYLLRCRRCLAGDMPTVRCLSELSRAHTHTHAHKIPFPLPRKMLSFSLIPPSVSSYSPIPSILASRVLPLGFRCGLRELPTCTIYT